MKQFPFLLPLLFLSCVSYERTVDLASMSLEYPVSASSSIYWEGDTISNDKYEVLTEVEFMKKSKQPLNNDRPSIPLDIQPDLDQILSEYGADGFVDVSIELMHSGSSDVNLVFAERAFGALAFISLTAPIIIFAPDISEIDPVDAAPYLGLVLGSGALFGGSFVHQHYGSVYFIYRIKAKAVRFQ